MAAVSAVSATVAVVGAGQMGGGIALTLAATAKLAVRLFDADQSQLVRQRHFIGTRAGPAK